MDLRNEILALKHELSASHHYKNVLKETIEKLENNIINNSNSNSNNNTSNMLMNVDDEELLKKNINEINIVARKII